MKLAVFGWVAFAALAAGAENIVPNPGVEAMGVGAKAAGWRAQVAALTPFMLLAGLSLLTLAAARPRTSLAREKKSVDAIAIMMTVDTSDSMNILDLTPKGAKFTEQTTRLAVVKRMFAEFAEKRPDDLIGLVTFGSYASTRAPLTADHEALLNVLKGVSIPVAHDRFGRQVCSEEAYTAIGDGLAVAVARLKEAKIKSKVVILLSDGLNKIGAKEGGVEPSEAAAAAAKLGIKVYAIGVGTNLMTTRLFRKDVYGRPYFEAVESGFDEGQLRSIAKQTGGTYFAVNDGDSLKEALEEIDQLETTKLEADAYNRWREFFNWFLLPGALLVLVAVGLSVCATRRMA